MARQPLSAPAVRRSEYLARALEQIQQQGQDIRSPVTLGTNLLATYLLDRNLDREQERERQLAEEADKPRREALANLMGAFGGGQPATPGQPQAVAMNAEGGGIVPVAPQQGGGAPPSLSDPGFINRLAAAQFAGVEGVDGIIDTLQAGQPQIAIGPDGRPYDARDRDTLDMQFRDVQPVNDFLVDVNDLDNVNRYVHDFQPGEEPVYDQNGNVVGVRNVAGAIQALGERTRATADADNASRASYAGVIRQAEEEASAPFNFVSATDSEGRPIQIAVSQIAGSGVVGQSPEDAIRIEGAAELDVARLEEARTQRAAAEERLRTYDNIESYLPDVVAGFGADVTLQGLRIAAAAGNEDAQRRVTATQTFEREARQIVASIIRGFGANPTEGERNYAERMSGADVQLTPQTIREGLELDRARARRQIDRANQLEQDFEAQTRGRQGGAQTGQPGIRIFNPVTGDFD